MEKDEKLELWLHRFTLPAVVAIATVFAIRLGEARSDISDYARDYNACQQELERIKK